MTTRIKLTGNTGMMSLSAIRAAFDCFDASGNKLSVGDKIVDFRGDTSEFGGMTRPPTPGKSGKIMADGRELYDKVFDIEIRLRDPQLWIDRATSYGARFSENEAGRWACYHNVAPAEFGDTQGDAAFWFCVENNCDEGVVNG